jgi:hypothetical protein
MLEGLGCFLFTIFYCIRRNKVGWDSSVGIATHCRLDGPGIEFWWEQYFLHLFRLALGLTQPPVQLVLDLLPGGKVAGVWR